MTTPNAAFRAHEHRCQAMLADPDCVGELLLVGLAMARSVDLDWPTPIGDGYRLKDVARAVYGNIRIYTDLALPATPGWQERRFHATSGAYQRLLAVLRADIRRYTPTDSSLVDCGRPRVRTDGTCGRPASPNHLRRLIDPATGERWWVGACSQTACKAWFAAVVEANRAECATHDVPVPAANTGGVLERHLPEIDWWKVWSHIDDKWSPPPEAEPFHRPRLQLILGDADVDPTPARPRPELVALKGGW